MKKITMIILLLIFTIWGFAEEKVVTLPELTNPDWFFYPISVDNNQLYIFDGYKSFIYSRPDYKLLASFGKKGPGPEEFIGYEFGKYVYGSISPDSIVIDSLGRVTLFSKKGEYKKEMRFGLGRIYKSFGDNDNFISLLAFAENNKNVGAITIYDKDLKKIKQVATYDLYAMAKGMNPYEYRKPYPAIYNEKLILDDPKDGTFTIFDKMGNKLINFKPDYKKVPVTEAHKAETIKLMKADPRLHDIIDRLLNWMAFPKHFPAVRHFSVSEGKIYILTYRVVKDKSEFMVFNMSGKFIKTIMFPLKNISFIEGYPYTIHKGKIFQLIDNEKKEKWELHITDIE